MIQNLIELQNEPVFILPVPQLLLVITSLPSYMLGVVPHRLWGINLGYKEPEQLQ